MQDNLKPTPGCPTQSKVISFLLNPYRQCPHQLSTDLRHYAFVQAPKSLCFLNVASSCYQAPRNPSRSPKASFESHFFTGGFAVVFAAPAGLGLLASDILTFPSFAALEAALLPLGACFPADAGDLAAAALLGGFRNSACRSFRDLRRRFRC